MLNVEPLDWDSKFFGFGVGRVAGQFESASSLTTAMESATACGLRLVYGICDHNDTTSRESAMKAGGELVDVKRTYSLNLGPDESTAIGIDKACDDPCSRRQLRALAWQAAEFSRFRLDSNFPKGSWRRMYTRWMENCISGQLADVILVYRVDVCIVGMITLTCRGSQCQIGLFAVDHRWRNQGIGQRLLGAAKQHCHTQGCTQLRVATQGDNIAACRGYEQAGFCLIEEQDIFHFWLHLRT